jgi:hypothetical protein
MYQPESAKKLSILNHSSIFEMNLRTISLVERDFFRKEPLNTVKRGVAVWLRLAAGTM